MQPAHIYSTYRFGPWQYPHEHPTHPGQGVGSFKFPAGGKLHGVSWQSIVRTPAHEVLFALKLRNGIDTILVPHHQVGREGPTIGTRDFMFGKSIALATGSELWVSIDGRDLTNPDVEIPDAVELQIVLWIEGEGVATPP